VRLDERVRHRPAGAYAVPVGAGDVAGAVESDHPADARELHRRVDPVAAAGREVDHGSSVGGVTAPGRLGGEHGLERDLVEEERLGQLCFGDRRVHFEDRLVGEHDRAFGDRPHRAGEAQRREPVEEVRPEDVEPVEGG
jgi:hypothetical protein